MSNEICVRTILNFSLQKFRTNNIKNKQSILNVMIATIIAKKIENFIIIRF